MFYLLFIRFIHLGFCHELNGSTKNDLKKLHVHMKRLYNEYCENEHLYNEYCFTEIYCYPKRLKGNIAIKRFMCPGVLVCVCVCVCVCVYVCVFVSSSSSSSSSFIYFK